MNEVTFAITGKTGHIDGYLELYLGMLALAGLLIEHEVRKRVVGNVSTITVYATLAEPPLGHMGEDDLKDVSDEEN